LISSFEALDKQKKDLLLVLDNGTSLPMICFRSAALENGLFICYNCRSAWILGK